MRVCNAVYYYYYYWLGALGLRLLLVSVLYFFCWEVWLTCATGFCLCVRSLFLRR